MELIKNTEASAAAMDDIPIQKIQIPGPTLASLLHRVSSAPGDIDGLLFGHVNQITPSNLTDDDPASSTTTAAESASLIATITSFFASTSTSSFYSSSGHLNIQSLPKFPLPAGDNLLGWFSSRRKTHIRPSMRESFFTSSLSSNTQFAFQVESFTLCPNLFILLTTPFIDQLIHTHDYRAYQFQFSTKSFEPKTLDIVNIGPAFRGHYGNFNPHSRLPSLPCQVKGFEAMVVEGAENLESMKRVSEDQKELDKSADGFDIGRLGRLMGSNAANYTGELEDLYSKMLAKLDGLARLVEKSSARVLEQENHNMKLRYKVAGLE